ncbi:hypothetical protein SETIT_7G018400v2 [Setaria italica]|uniref:NPH3 domain-containing protein n=2 Tax=Setaria italica TaxID=4555 RepID=A0A368RR66_SETIT|nr:coleoptile phototropism protein 1 [Setaria italica]RCV32631.1 hypothetical protein SETIT_7G018400v2 [Setaria italica]
MEIWEAMERENHVAERGLVPIVNGVDVQVQHEHGGAKMDMEGFVRRGQSCRYASSDIPSDLLVKVGGVNFHLHKHPMISRSARLARLVDEASALHGPIAATVVELPDLPGGHGAFELAAKFCYGVVVDITAANVAVLRCAAEYLEMTEELEEGNLAFRAEAFLSYVVASSWQDSVAVLRSCEGLSPWAEDLQLVRRCSESVAAKACTNPRAMRWAYAAGRMSPAKTTARAGASSGDTGQQPAPPPDWWVDDVCVLRIDHFVRVITAVQAKGMRGDLVGAAITRYSFKWLNIKESPASHGHGHCALEIVIAGEGDTQTTPETDSEQRMVVESLISIIPAQKDSVSCSFLLRLLRLAVTLKAAPALVTEVEKRVGMQLDQAALSDILIPSSSYPYGRLRSDAAYDVDLVQRLVEQFVVQEQSSSSTPSRGKEENTRSQRVASLIDSYLSEVSRDRHLPLGKFQALAESVPEPARGCHDGLYRAVDSYLKAHPAATEHERKRLCRAVDCGKLSREVRAHAAENERLPLRVAVRVLLAEQAKMAASIGRAGRKEDDVAALRMEVEIVNARYMELQREVELLQRQVERMLPPPSAAGKQQSVSGWASGWKKLGRLGRIQVEQPVVTVAPGETGSREPRRRRNSAS